MYVNEVRLACRRFRRRGRRRQERLWSMLIANVDVAADSAVAAVDDDVDALVLFARGI